MVFCYILFILLLLIVMLLIFIIGVIFLFDEDSYILFVLSKLLILKWDFFILMFVFVKVFNVIFWVMFGNNWLFSGGVYIMLFFMINMLYELVFVILFVLLCNIVLFIFCFIFVWKCNIFFNSEVDFIW